MQVCSGAMMHTPHLINSCRSGKHYPEAKITAPKVGENPIAYYIITMTDVLITSDFTGSGTEERLAENGALNFSLKGTFKKFKFLRRPHVTTLVLSTSGNPLKKLILIKQMIFACRP